MSFSKLSFKLFLFSFNHYYGLLIIAMILSTPTLLNRLKVNNLMGVQLLSVLRCSLIIT